MDMIYFFKNKTEYDILTCLKFRRVLSRSLAAVLGLPYSFAHFINPHAGPAAVATYRQNFKPDGDRRAEPDVNVCVIALCAETEAEVDELAGTAALWRLQIGRASCRERV